MDDIDRRLLGLLRANARSPAASLAKKLKVSRGTVQNRIAAMLARGAIQGFTVRIKPELEKDRVRAFMSIVIEGEKTAKVIAALRGFAEVEKIHTTNGRWDLVAELSAENLRAFALALDGIRTIEGIATTETSILLATVSA
jgi:DNA-binding Lrp family transcriptional regulator